MSDTPDRETEPRLTGMDVLAASMAAEAPAAGPEALTSDRLAEIRNMAVDSLAGDASYNPDVWALETARRDLLGEVDRLIERDRQQRAAAIRVRLAEFTARREQGSPGRSADEIRAAIAETLREEMDRDDMTVTGSYIVADALMDRVVGPLVAELRDQVAMQIAERDHWWDHYQALKLRPWRDGTIAELRAKLDDAEHRFENALAGEDAAERERDEQRQRAERLAEDVSRAAEVISDRHEEIIGLRQRAERAEAYGDAMAEQATRDQATIAEATARLDSIRKLHRKHVCESPGECGCEDDRAESETGEVCGHCTRPWPCTTINILNAPYDAPVLDGLDQPVRRGPTFAQRVHEALGYGSVAAHPDDMLKRIADLRETVARVRAVRETLSQRYEATALSDPEEHGVEREAELGALADAIKGLDAALGCTDGGES